MASGGARARSGPPPDPNALRRDRKDDAASWKILPGPRTEPAPEFPLPNPSDRELEVWAADWARPQAHEWARLGMEYEVALYVRAFVEAEKPEASGQTRNFVRMTRENLGLSIPGLARHRWIIADDSASAVSSASSSDRPRSSRSSSRATRDRFRVVTNDEVASE